MSVRTDLKDYFNPIQRPSQLLDVVKGYSEAQLRKSIATYGDPYYTTACLKVKIINSYGQRVPSEACLSFYDLTDSPTGEPLINIDFTCEVGKAKLYFTRDSVIKLIDDVYTFINGRQPSKSFTLTCVYKDNYFTPEHANLHVNLSTDEAKFSVPALNLTSFSHGIDFKFFFESLIYITNGDILRREIVTR